MIFFSEYVQNQKTPTPPTKTSKVVEKNEPAPTIFAITHTRKRLTQLLDLTSLCQSLMNVENIVWIIVENTFKKTALVSDLLTSCKVNSVHLLSTKYSMLTNGTDILSGRYGLQRGAKEKNVGLEWIRKWCQKPENCSGLVYFLDDESKYDLRLFEEVMNIKPQFDVYSCFQHTVYRCGRYNMLVCGLLVLLEKQSFKGLSVKMGLVLNGTPFMQLRCKYCKT